MQHQDQALACWHCGGVSQCTPDLRYLAPGAVARMARPVLRATWSSTFVGAAVGTAVRIVRMALPRSPMSLFALTAGKLGPIAWPQHLAALMLRLSQTGFSFTFVGWWLRAPPALGPGKCTLLLSLPGGSDAGCCDACLLRKTPSSLCYCKSCGNSRKGYLKTGHPLPLLVLSGPFICRSERRLLGLAASRVKVGERLGGQTSKGGQGCGGSRP